MIYITKYKIKNSPFMPLKQRLTTFKDVEALRRLTADHFECTLQDVEFIYVESNIDRTLYRCL